VEWSEKKPFHLQLRLTAQGWRIHDIAWGDHPYTLRRLTALRY
jgi:hypothetical protein